MSLRRTGRPTPRLALALALLLSAAACGARSELREPPVVEDAGAVADAGDRICPSECFAGHECCLGSCDGPAVEMPSDCCQCLPGEVSTMKCDEAHCGGD